MSSTSTSTEISNFWPAWLLFSSKLGKPKHVQRVPTGASLKVGLEVAGQQQLARQRARAGRKESERPPHGINLGHKNESCHVAGQDVGLGGRMRDGQ